jgi:hypothetical protein
MLEMPASHITASNGRSRRTGARAVRRCVATTAVFPEPLAPNRATATIATLIERSQRTSHPESAEICRQGADNQTRGNHAPDAHLSSLMRDGLKGPRSHVEPVTISCAVNQTGIPPATTPDA